MIRIFKVKPDHDNIRVDRWFKINISKKVRTFIKKKFKLDKPKIYVSLSDENKHSIAYVILENT